MTSDNPAYFHLPEPFVVPTYSPEQLDDMARTGTTAMRIIVASRHNCPVGVLEWLMANDESEEVKREIIQRMDVTPKRLVWAGTTSSDANTLGRVAGHRLTPLETVRAIQAKAAEREGDVWVELAAFASRVIKRRETGQFEWGHADTTTFAATDQAEHPDESDG